MRPGVVPNRLLGALGAGVGRQHARRMIADGEKEDALACRRRLAGGGRDPEGKVGA